ncbi:MAG: inositol monophosphatase family protein [bacterium]
MMTDWLGISRKIAAEIRAEVGRYSGTAKGRAVVSERGAGGDETVYLDALAEEILFKHLRELSSGGEKFRVLTEETGFVDFGAQFPIVVVDPVDGSMNAKMGLPFYAFSIAVYEGGTMADGIFGYVMNLADGSEFHAERGGEAYYRSEPVCKIEEKDTIDFLSIELPNDLAGIEKVMPVVMDAYKVRVMGSLALGICYAAAGVLDLFLHLKRSRVLDYAAAKVIMEAAGGKITDEKGSGLDGLPIDLERRAWLAASRHENLIKKVYECFR